MQKVFSFLLVASTLQHFKFPKQDLLSSLVQSLDEMKGSNNATKLETKHVILTMIVSSDNRSSYKQKVCLRNVHLKNVVKAIKRWKLMNTFGDFLWTLSICSRRLDILSLATKVTILAWWYYETHVSPNCKWLKSDWHHTFMILSVHNIY